jgi:hypothetical protein
MIVKSLCWGFLFYQFLMSTLEMVTMCFTCWCLKVQQSFLATNNLWCLGCASHSFPCFPKWGSWQNWLCNVLLYDPGNERWNFSFKDRVLRKESWEALVSNPYRKFKVDFSVCFNSWEGLHNYLGLVFTEFTMRVLTPISVFSGHVL